jgi:hypothetical protein
LQQWARGSTLQEQMRSWHSEVNVIRHTMKIRSEDAVPVLLVALLVILSPVQANAVERIHVWVKAFIPNVIPSDPGYVTAVPGRPGEFMIWGPPLIFDPALILFDDPTLLWQTCYLTDNRSFSPDVSARARLTTEFVLVVDGSTARVEHKDGREFHYSSGSAAVNCITLLSKIINSSSCGDWKERL